MRHSRWRPQMADDPTSNLVDDVEGARARFRGAGRRAFGVTGEAGTVPLFAELTQHGLNLYALVALGLLLAVDGFQLSAFVVLAPEISRTLGVDKSVIALMLLMLSSWATGPPADPFGRSTNRCWRTPTHPQCASASSPTTSYSRSAEQSRLLVWWLS